MTLLYFHLVSIDDINGLHAITFNDGTLPDVETFRQTYYDHHTDKKEMENALTFRNFDSIKVKEDTKTDTDVAVEINVSFGLYTSSIIYGLKKEMGVWKMDILHFFD